MGNNKKSDFVIVGGVACGPKTAAVLARRLPNAKITLFEKGKYISYATCGLPYFASGDIDDFSQLNKTSYGINRDAGFFQCSKGFDVITNAEVVKIDRRQKSVTVRMAKDGQEFKHGYDKLVLATGGVSKKPPFPVAESPLIKPFIRPDDALHFRSMAQQGKIGQAVIIGGGMIGCELAEAMRGLWGIEATLIEKENQLLPYALDSEMAAIAQREMQRNGVNIMTGSGAARIDIDNDGKPIVQLESGEQLSSDIVFLCLGISPEVSLAKECGLAIGKTGAIEVDSFMRTSDPDIYAGGDCVESVHQIKKRKIYLPMGSIANRHGRVIAENLAGNPTEFPGVLGAFLLKVFDINVGSVGLSEEAAKDSSLEPKNIWGTFADKPDYYPESKVMTVKMTYQRRNDKLALLGIQAAGKGDVSRIVDVFSVFLQRESAVKDLFDYEHGYAPPYSEALDPLHHLAGMAMAQGKGLKILGPNVESISADNIPIWLDVREIEEVESEKWPLPKSGELINIPLGDLINSLGKLDRTKEVIVICRRGPRAYQASIILKKAGFEKVSIVGGGVQAAFE
jgi:NADPH-dependent 2,4-dienoyl-CoA reductase/sulfur reductase-like enzyme/rhodanese-related sulfurtransferase